MENSEKSAHPITELTSIKRIYGELGIKDFWVIENKSNGGLTKREYFAGLAMQGILSCQTLPTTNGKEINTQPEISKWCVDMADELLKQLNENNGKA